MQDLKNAVDRFEPMPTEQGDWDGVVREARRRRPVLLGSVAGVGLASAALFALILFQPWSVEQRTFLERALAAVDDGPVIHALLRHGEGATNVNLETGGRTRVYGEAEIWYDPERGRIRVATLLGGTVTHESVYEEDHASRELIALGRDYKAALESGSARTAGEEVIDGERVTWVVVVAEMLPHAGGPLREWTQQVAVSQETFKPVATRDAIGGEPVGHTMQRVLELEALPADEVDLELPKERLEEAVFQGGGDPIPLDRAAGALGRAPVWLGRQHAGLPLRKTAETWLRRGTYKETLLEGQAAEDAKACRLRPGGLSRIEEPSDACERARERGSGFSQRGDTVYAHGRPVFGPKRFGVSLTYGDEEDVFGPLEASTKPYVHLSQATDRSALLRGAAYFPPPGFVSLAGGRSGSLVVDGLYVVIHASSPELVLSAARALKPMG
jgi:hypothetical protein